jgi:hypothetical protein
VAGDDGQIYRAALGDLRDGTGASALGEARKEECPGGVTEGAEEVRVKEVVQGRAAGDGLTRGLGILA